MLSMWYCCVILNAIPQMKILLLACLGVKGFVNSSKYDPCRIRQNALRKKSWERKHNTHIKRVKGGKRTREETSPEEESELVLVQFQEGQYTSSDDEDEMPFYQDFDNTAWNVNPYWSPFK